MLVDLSSYPVIKHKAWIDIISKEDLLLARKHLSFRLLLTFLNNQTFLGEAKGFHIFQLDNFLVLKDTLLPSAMKVYLADIFLTTYDEKLMILMETFNSWVIVN